MRLIVKEDTVFKKSVKQSKELGEEEKRSMSKGRVIEIGEHLEIKGTGHIRIKTIGTREEWFVYSGHIEIEGNYSNNNPIEERVDLVNRGKIIEVMGVGKKGINEAIIPGGHFNWGEATKGGTRIPVNREIVRNIIKTAGVMEEIRKYLGDRPIVVTSWYRDPITNRRVGGVRQSRHLVGDAVDFVVSGINAMEVYRRLDNWWGARGGLASSNTFTHIDLRGYKARWKY